MKKFFLSVVIMCISTTLFSMDPQCPMWIKYKNASAESQAPKKRFLIRSLELSAKKALELLKHNEPLSSEISEEYPEPVNQFIIKIKLNRPSTHDYSMDTEQLAIKEYPSVEISEKNMLPVGSRRNLKKRDNASALLNSSDSKRPLKRSKRDVA